jgi:glutathione S-transferase
MNLYFAPLACSMATRIALYEAGASASYTFVDLHTKRLADGADYFQIAPLGQVPALVMDDGTLLTENTAVLQYVADRFPEARLAPKQGKEHARLQQWLGFIGTEIHKAIYIPILDAKAAPEVKAYSKSKIPLRFGFLEKHLAQNEYLLKEFSIADAYLVTVLNWTRATDIDLGPYPAVVAYRDRLFKRPSVAKAFAEEWAMYKEEQARHAAA